MSFYNSDEVAKRIRNLRNNIEGMKNIPIEVLCDLAKELERSAKAEEIGEPENILSEITKALKDLFLLFKLDSTVIMNYYEEEAYRLPFMSPDELEEFREWQASRKDIF